MIHLFYTAIPTTVVSVFVFINEFNYQNMKTVKLRVQIWKFVLLTVTNFIIVREAQ